MPKMSAQPTIKRLAPDSLYIFLYRHPNPKIRFHWALYHHANATDGGWRFDIITPEGNWAPAVRYNGVPSPDVIEDERWWPLGCAVRLGKLEVEGDLCPRTHLLIRKEDNELSEVDAKVGWTLSCRVYVQRACTRLLDDGLLAFPEWEQVESEVLRVGDRCEKESEVVIVDSEVARFLEQS